MHLVLNGKLARYFKPVFLYLAACATCEPGHFTGMRGQNPRSRSIVEQARIRCQDIESVGIHQHWYFNFGIEFFHEFGCFFRSADTGTYGKRLFIAQCFLDDLVILDGEYALGCRLQRNCHGFPQARFKDMVQVIGHTEGNKTGAAS